MLWFFLCCCFNHSSRKSPMNCNLWWSLMAVVSPPLMDCRPKKGCQLCQILMVMRWVTVHQKGGFSSLIGYSNQESCISFFGVVSSVEVLAEGSPIYDICIVGRFATSLRKHSQHRNNEVINNVHFLGNSGVRSCGESLLGCQHKTTPPNPATDDKRWLLPRRKNTPFRGLPGSATRSSWRHYRLYRKQEEPFGK